MPVELVFIHGWGFTPDFWKPLAADLPDYVQTRIDLGFFGTAAGKLNEPKTDCTILVGHSLGFLYGMQSNEKWNGWIAINSFACFKKGGDAPGCATLAELRDIRKRLQADPKLALKNFHGFGGSVPPVGNPDVPRLSEGLDELRDIDITAMLARLDVPGLALASHDDPLVPPEASEHLGGLAKKGGMLWNDMPNHILPQASPAWCALAIKNFIGENFKNK